MTSSEAERIVDQLIEEARNHTSFLVISPQSLRANMSDVLRGLVYLIVGDGCMKDPNCTEAIIAKNLASMVATLEADEYEESEELEKSVSRKSLPNYIRLVANEGQAVEEGSDS